jgi:hypothetical protein
VFVIKQLIFEADYRRAESINAPLRSKEHFCSDWGFV